MCISSMPAPKRSDADQWQMVLHIGSDHVSKKDASKALHNTQLHKFEIYQVR
jgi:hypothetical protein